MKARASSNNREGHTDGTPTDIIFTWTKKGVRCYPKFQLLRDSIEGVLIFEYFEGQGVYMVTTISVRWLPLFGISILPDETIIDKCRFVNCQSF